MIESIPQKYRSRRKRSRRKRSRRKRSRRKRSRRKPLTFEKYTDGYKNINALNKLSNLQREPTNILHYTVGYFLIKDNYDVSWRQYNENKSKVMDEEYTEFNKSIKRFIYFWFLIKSFLELYDNQILHGDAGHQNILSVNYNTNNCLIKNFISIYCSFHINQLCDIVWPQEIYLPLIIDWEYINFFENVEDVNLIFHEIFHELYLTDLETLIIYLSFLYYQKSNNKFLEYRKIWGRLYNQYKSENISKPLLNQLLNQLKILLTQLCTILLENPFQEIPNNFLNARLSSDDLYTILIPKELPNEVLYNKPLDINIADGWGMKILLKEPNQAFNVNGENIILTPGQAFNVNVNGQIIQVICKAKEIKTVLIHAPF